MIKSSDEMGYMTFLQRSDLRLYECADDELSTAAKIIEIHYNLQYPLIFYFFLIIF